MGPPAGIIAGNLLVAIVASNAGISGGVTGDWVLIVTTGGTPILSMYAKIAEAGDPAHWTWTNGVNATWEGAILAYSTSGPILGPAVSAVNTVPVQAPSIQQWKPASLVLEAWSYFGNSAANPWAITTNINGPVTRVARNTGNGGLFVVEYGVPSFSASTGDSAGGITANIRGTLSAAIG